jgi:hypothetical protein
MADDWQNQGLQGGYYEQERVEMATDGIPGNMGGMPMYYPNSQYHGYSGVPMDSYQMMQDTSGMYGGQSGGMGMQPSGPPAFLPQAFMPTPYRANTQQMDLAPSYGFKADSPAGEAMDADEFEEANRKSKKRRFGGAPAKSDKPKRSILEEMLIILDEGTHGIKWCLKIDTEGDVQDGMQIYNDTALEHTLEERRGVPGYGLSKHLAKDLRYYGFVYDRETKVFWNEDHKHPLTRRSYWQKDHREKCLQLKRMTSEAERNLARLTSLMKNGQLAEILKLPEHMAVCPPPSKYIILNELPSIFIGFLPSDAHNIKILLAHFVVNDVVRHQWELGNLPTKAFDHLITRLGTTCPDLLVDLREFVAGAIKWYHGLMERDEAVGLLHGQPEGTFLLRESTQSDCYSLSWVKADPLQQRLLVNHMRIEQTSAGFAVHGDDSPARTLVQWISNHSTYLKHPLPSARYANLSVVQTAEKRLYSTTDGALPANYIRGFPSRMDPESPASPSSSN